MELVPASTDRLDCYVDALRRGWSPRSSQPDFGASELLDIERDAAAFVAAQDRREDPGTTTLPDGTVVDRVPGFHRWIWDGDFAGIASLRWQPGTAALPWHVLGHVGYGVVPWRRRRGYAAQAVRLLLPAAVEVGLPYVEIVVDEPNVASQRVALAAGGILVERFTLPESYGATPARRYRVPTS